MQNDGYMQQKKANATKKRKRTFVNLENIANQILLYFMVSISFVRLLPYFSTIFVNPLWDKRPKSGQLAVLIFKAIQT